MDETDVLGPVDYVIVEFPRTRPTSRVREAEMPMMARRAMRREVMGADTGVSDCLPSAPLLSSL
jgi:hypothetical protein